MPYPDFDLTGRIAIVTGAARGLSRGMAVALAEAGATVIAADRSKAGVEETADIIRKLGSTSHAILFDAVKTRGMPQVGGRNCRALWQARHHRR